MAPSPRAKRPAPPKSIPLSLPSVRLPRWVGSWLAQHAAGPLRTTDARMALAIGLARENVRRNTGGPFGAAIFETNTGKLVSAGVNRVEQSGQSFAHAEMVAIALAQHARRTYDLGAGQEPLELVTSSEPCAMCFGAVPWSGVRRLVCGARASDAEAIGFDEGPKPKNWSRALERRGIEVLGDVHREQAIEVLESYAAAGTAIYNPSR